MIISLLSFKFTKRARYCNTNGIPVKVDEP